MKKILTVFLFAELFLLFSCQNAFNSLDSTSSASDQTVKITRYFDVNGAVPQNFLPKADSNNKAAFPSVSPGTTTYKAILKNLTDGTTISTDDNPSPSAISIDTTNKTITLELTVNKQYVITVQCVLFDDHNTVLLEGSCEPFTLTPKNTVFSEKFLLEPKREGTGRADLAISLDTNLAAKTDLTVNIVRVRNLGTGEIQSCFKINYNLGNTVVLLNSGNSNSPSDIPAGQYSVEIELRDNIQRIYFIKEVVNVFNNLKTDTFVKNTDEEYYRLNASNKIEIYVTEEMTKHFISSTKYVDSNSTSQSEEGTWTNPYKTLAQAIRAIPSDSTHGYIHIKDGHSEDINEGFDITQNLTIECYKDMPGDGKGNATFKFVSIDLLLFDVENTCANFDITGITLDGNNKSSGNAGLFINTGILYSINITATNCTVINCLATPNGEGGAIFNAGTLTLNNCTLINNSLEQGSQVDEETGGAIYNKGTLTLNNTTITGNTAEIAGGVYTTKPIVIQGTTIIKDNKSIDDCGNETASNLYLAKDTGTPNLQSYIDCTDSIPASGSEIHITTETKPTVAEPVTVLKNFYSHSGCKPEDFFISDEDYPIVKNGSTDNACLKIGGGTLTVKTFDDIKISIDKNCFKKSDSGTDRYFTFTVSDGTTTHTKKDSDVTKVTIELYKNDEKYVTSGIALNETFSMLFPAKKTSGGAEYDMPFGIYTAIASVTYKNKTYQAAFDIEYCDTYPSLKYVTDLPEAGTTYAVNAKEELEKIKDWADGGKLKDNPIEIVLTSDIVVDNSFSGIGSAKANRFEGTINGNDHTISGLTKSLINFGKGTIKNLTIEGNITGHAAFISNYTSGNNGASGKITIENCINKANINNITTPGSGHSVDIGAFVGTNDGNETTIVNCINYGNITADTYITSIYIGGITGASSATIINCANYGDINGQCYSGGITPKPCTIKNCVNYGNVTGNIAGGIVGEIHIYSSTKNPYSIQNCVNFGTIIGKKPSTKDPSVGQIIGNLKVDDGKSDLFDYDFCYYLKGKDSTGADYTAVGSSSGYTKTPENIHDFTFDPNATDNLKKYKITYEDAGITITEYLLQILNSYATTFSADGCCQWKLDKSIPPKPMLDFSTITP